MQRSILLCREAHPKCTADSVKTGASLALKGVLFIAHQTILGIYQRPRNGQIFQISKRRKIWIPETIAHKLDVDTDV